MAENAGKLEVEYVVISDAAVRRLERLQKQFDKVGDAAEEQGKKTQDAYKKQIKAIAAFGAIVTGVLYSVIKASSYASMWMDQLKYSVMRLSDKLLEMTGMREAIDNLFKALDTLIDEIEDPEKTEFWSELAEDFANLDTKSQLATIALIGIAGALGIIAIAIGLLGLSSLSSGLAGIGLGSIGAVGGISALVLAFAVLVGAILGGIVVFILWKTGILEAISEIGAVFGAWIVGLGEKFGVWVATMGLRFRIWVDGIKEKLSKLKTDFFNRIVEMGAKFGSWISGMGEKFGTWIANTKEKLSTFKTDMGAIFDGIWKYIIDGLKTMKDDFFGIITSLINKISDLITEILSIPSIPWVGGGGSSSGYGTTKKSERSGSWGGAAATGAHVLRTGAVMVHQGEDIINLKNMMSGSESDKGSREIIINNTININSGNLNNPIEVSRVANAISKRMGEEVYRISTSI